MSDYSDNGCQTGSVRVLIADDHALVRTGLRMILGTEEGIEVVGEANNGAQALALALAMRPTIVLADISMPPPDGIELARLLHQDAPEVKTIIVSMHEEDAMVRGAEAAGAAGYVLKRSGATALIRAIRDVAAGRMHLDPELHAH